MEYHDLLYSYTVLSVILQNINSSDCIQTTIGNNSKSFEVTKIDKQKDSAEPKMIIVVRSLEFDKMLYVSFSKSITHMKYTALYSAFLRKK